MRAFVLLIPFILISFVLLAFINRDAIKRAATFAPVKGKEKGAYLVYQCASIAIFVHLLMLKVDINQSNAFYISLLIYALGLILLALSMISLAKPSKEGLNLKGIYRISRNPMYVAYFVYFIGCAMLAKSWVLLMFVLLFQISSHWIILSEERWCLQNFREEYAQYMRQVRRYI